MTAVAAFLASVDSVRPLLASPAVATGWDSPSSLATMSIGALAGHLMRAVTTMDGSLDASIEDGPALDAPGYFLSLKGLSGPGGVDLASPLHVGIRQRAASEGAGGPVDVLARWDAAAGRLAARLPSESPTRLVAARGGRAMTLDDYAVTRLVEVVVHADDLAVSVGLEMPALPSEAYALATSCLVEVAARRHGNLGVLRALARRERDPDEALRVL